MTPTPLLPPLLRPIVALALAAGLAAPAAAQEGMPTVDDIPELAARLDSTNTDEVREAIAMLTIVDDDRVIPHLTRLLRSGRQDVVVDDALGALRGLARPSSLDVLAEFTHHRRARARRRAYQAIAAIEDPQVRPLLEQGLRDSERNIRAACARTLGRIEARESVPVLFLAFERGVVEAAIPIGKMGDASTVERFGQHLGDMPLSVMLSGYRHYLSRRDIPQQVKVQIIEQLEEISGPMIRSFFQRYLDTLPSSGRRSRSPVRTAVVTALRRIQAAAEEAAAAAQGDTP
jgi:hypothetical protein